MCMRMNERMNMRVYACGCPCSHVDAMWMLLTQYSCCIQTIPNLNGVTFTVQKRYDSQRQTINHAMPHALGCHVNQGCCDQKQQKLCFTMVCSSIHWESSMTAKQPRTRTHARTLARSRARTLACSHHVKINMFTTTAKYVQIHLRCSDFS